MGFGSESLTKQRSISLHRAVRRALELEGYHDGRMTREEWRDYCARAGNVGSVGSQKNLNYRLQALGLLQVEDDGVIVLESDYSNMILDDD